MAHKATSEKDLQTNAKQEIVEKIRQTVAERETTPTQPSKSYEKFKQYIETMDETEPLETQQVLIDTEPTAYNDIYISHILCGVGGVVLGALVVFLIFRIKIRRIKDECESKVSEAREILDRMISVMAKE